jgi:hypothetical protein
LTGKSGKPTSIVYGEADDVEEETADSLHGTAVTGAQASREGFAETTSGRSRSSCDAARVSGMNRLLLIVCALLGFGRTSIRLLLGFSTHFVRQKL